MPGKPRWLLAIPDAIRQLDRDILTRRDLERLFGVSKVRATALMTAFDAGRTGPRLTLPRAALLRQLRRHRTLAAFRGEETRRDRVVTAIRQARLIGIRGAVPRAARGAAADRRRGARGGGWFPFVKQYDDLMSRTGRCAGGGGGMRGRLAIATVLAGLVLAGASRLEAQDVDARQLARDIFEELVEINTVTATGDTFEAAEAVAARLRAAGFDGDDVQVFSPAPRKGNLVARLRGTGVREPILLMAHLDVVEALPEDWTVEPFTFLERDGYYYGRGTTDDKNLVAAWLANLIRYKQEGFVPDRDLVLVLETDEENGDANALGIQWLIANHRDLLEAEFALNEGGRLQTRGDAVLSNDVQTSEKRYTTFRLDVRNPGGHSSVPARDNAIYHLAAGLTRLADHEFPVQLNETTRAWLERAAAFQPPAIGQAMRAMAAGTADEAALEELASRPVYNAQLRTTCVATMLDGGHAENALPQLASATVNCRIIPGGSPEGVQATLNQVLADPAIDISPVLIDPAGPASEINEALFTVIEDLSEEYWPGVPVIPSMSAGATDSRFVRGMGVPAYGHTGFAGDVDDVRAHGQDERIGVEAFHTGVEYLYELVKRLSSAP